MLVLIDGHPAPGALIENRDLSRVSTSGVQRIEVVRGPLSSTYGSDALAGVVNVVTRAPEPGFRVGGRARWGGLGRRDAELSASGGGRLRAGATAALAPGGPGPGSVRFRRRLGRGGSRRGRLRAYGTCAFARTTTPRRVGASGPRRGGAPPRTANAGRWAVGSTVSTTTAGLSGWVEARWSPPESGGEEVAGDWRGNRSFFQDYEHLYRSARGAKPRGGAPRTSPQWEREAKLTASYAFRLGDQQRDRRRRGRQARDPLARASWAESQVADALGRRVRARPVRVGRGLCWRSGRAWGGTRAGEPTFRRRPGADPRRWSVAANKGEL